MDDPVGSCSAEWANLVGNLRVTRGRRGHGRQIRPSCGPFAACRPVQLERLPSGSPFAVSRGGALDRDAYGGGMKSGCWIGWRDMTLAEDANVCVDTYVVETVGGE